MIWSIVMVALAAPPERVAFVPPTVAEETQRDALTRYGLGVLLLRDDRPATALKQFETAAKLDPTSPEPRRPLVQIYSDLGRNPAAIRTAREVLRLDPTDADTAHSLGLLLYEGKKFADAVTVLKQAADSPRVADRPVTRLGILRDLARVGEAAGQFPEAESALRSALELITAKRADLLRTRTFSEPDSLDRETATITEKLGQALTSQKKFAEAAQMFTRAAALFADTTASARLNWNLSGVYTEAGDPTRALDHLQKFLALGPTNPEPYRRYADLLRRLGRLETVIRATLAQLADQRPQIPAIRWVQALEIGRSDPSAAQRRFRELAKTTDDPAFFRIAMEHYRTTRQPGDFLTLADELYRLATVGTDEDANGAPKKPADRKATLRAQAFTTAARADRELARQVLRFAADAGAATDHANETWELIAGFAEVEGRLDLAEKALRAAQVNGRDREESVRLLEVLSKQRKWKELQRECTRLIAENRGNRPLMYDVYLAYALAEQGNDRAIEVAAGLPALAVGAGPWARLQKPRVMNMLGKYEKAVVECESLLKEFPRPADSRRIRFILSDALLGSKQYARGEAELRTVLEDDPDDVQTLNNLGYNLADQGRKLDEAEAMIRRAMELDHDERLRLGNPEPESGVYLDSLGWVLFRRGKLTEAREVLEKAAGLPDAATDPVVWDHLGDVAFRQGDPARAKTAWEKALELYVNTHQGRQADRRVEALRKLRLVP